MILISKCKSSINASFQALGYGIVSSGSAHASPLIRLFPELAHNHAEFRQWTIRNIVNQENNLLNLSLKKPVITRKKRHVINKTKMLTYGQSNDWRKTSISQCPSEPSYFLDFDRNTGSTFDREMQDMSDYFY